MQVLVFICKVATNNEVRNVLICNKDIIISVIRIRCLLIFTVEHRLYEEDFGSFMKVSDVCLIDENEEDNRMNCSVFFFKRVIQQRKFIYIVGHVRKSVYLHWLLRVPLLRLLSRHHSITVGVV